MGRAAVLWTGGKDSALASYEARQAGHELTRLVTFAGAARFRAHPLTLMEEQSRAMGLPHTVVRVTEPYRESYHRAICDLRDADRIDLLVTGDIAAVDGYPNWVRECAEGTGVSVLTPLWGADREPLLRRLLEVGFRAVFSAVKRPWFTPDWLGRELTAGAIAELRQKSALTGLDLCGEQGEYHTVVTGGPGFSRPVNLGDWMGREEGDLMYLAWPDR